MYDDEDLTDREAEKALALIGEIEAEYVTVEVKECVACSGSGKYDAYGSPRCGSCNGHGKEPVSERQMWELGDKVANLSLYSAQDAEQLSTRIHEHMSALGIGWNGEYCFVGE